jgi:capsular polysaccharide transport system permease protein
MDQAVRGAEQMVPTRPDIAAERRYGRVPRVWRWIQRHIVFVLAVVVPTVTAAVYYGAIASGVYISESRFVVRSPQKSSPAGGLLGNLLEGTGISRSQDDTYLVHDFILSRDAVKELDSRLGIRASFSSHSIDWFNRFPTMGLDDSFEAFYQYYAKHVGVEYDTSSSISVLTVTAYTAEEAQKINRTLLDMSERLVNSLNDRSRRDLVEFAERDIALAEQKAQDASLALLAYRSKQAVFEPDKQAAIQLEGVAKIQEELIATEAQLAQLRKISPDNPQIRGLESRAETLRTAIRTEASKVTDGSGSYSARAPEFERLALQSEFADKQLGIAMASLETARSEAMRKQLYLERLVQPSLPDQAMEPRRFRGVVTIFLLGVVLWGVASLVIAAIREHAE